ncbi:hypothetical protein [Streptomyces sp. CAU 1734]|uniref:hypothetical protein n=1 Tax=Streptomyces sp. CAU 1734 TaxID=3140360 RepID=UPI00326140CF
MIRLPLAQDLDKEIYNPHEFHNRVRKALLTAAELRASHFSGVITTRGINSLTQDHMADAARRIGERPPTVNPEGSPTADLIITLLNAVRTAQPSGRGRGAHPPPWLTGFTEDLHQAIPIAFDAFWNTLDGHPTHERVDSLTVRQLAATARRIDSTARTTPKVGPRTEHLVRHLLGTICDAQAEASGDTPIAVTSAGTGQHETSDTSSLTEVVAAAVSAAAESRTPTIVVLNFPQ